MIDKGLSSLQRQQGIYFADNLQNRIDYRRLSNGSHARDTQ
ncbi:MAG: hypothetical protein ACLTYW_11105 [Collinsella sp.]